MLENVLKADWLEKNPRYAFLIGIIYSFIAIISAYVIFPRSQGLASIAFLSLLLAPSLNRILKIEELQAVSERAFNVKNVFRDHLDVLSVYFMLFLGIFLAYALLSLKMPNLLVSGVFDNQLKVIGLGGNATASGLDFYSIFSNNFKVASIFLILSLVFGAGSIFFLAWNASVWGVIFAYVAMQSRYFLDAFTTIFIKVAPHMFLEAGAYFFAIVGGGIMSQAILREKFGSKKFNYVLKDGLLFCAVALILLVLGAYVEVFIYPLF